MAKSNLSPAQFYAEFLPKVISALAAMGGAVWILEEQGRLTLGHQINLQHTRLRDDQEGQIRHGRLLQRVLTTGEGALVPAHSGSAGDDEAGNPTDFLLVIAPLKAADETVGVVEIFQRPDTRPATQKGYLRFLGEMCDRAGEFFKTHQLRHYSDRQALWSQLESFTRGVHASLDPRETAYMIANEGRRLIECDRVSVAIRRGRRCHVESVSGQDLFDKRSNTVRLLGRLATAVVASGEPVWYTGDTSDMAPQVEDAIQEYVDESHSKTVAVMPLFRPVPEPDDEKEEQEQREYPEPPIGALIVEQIEDSRVPERMIQRVEVVTEHSATALANALDHSNLFLMPLWKKIGKLRWVVRARTLPKSVGAAALVVAALLSLVLVPWNFDMQAKGTLQPVERRDVFAEIDGEVETVEVDHGDPVEPGQLLAKLRSTDVNLEKERIRLERDATLEKMQAIRFTLRSGSAMTEADKLRLRTDLRELEVQADGYRQQLKLVEEREKKLEVRSPCAGRVGTWDVRNWLTDRPVQRGQKLMWIFNPEGEWQLEILMPERRMGNVVEHQQTLADGERLRVEFILASEPNTKRIGWVREIHDSAEVHKDDEGNTVLIKVAIDDEVKRELPASLRPGMVVTAKIQCGKRAVGYVLFHDLIAFLRTKVLFRWF